MRKQRPWLSLLLCLPLLSLLCSACSGAEKEAAPAEAAPAPYLFDASATSWIAAPREAWPGATEGDDSYRLEADLRILDESAGIAFGFHPADLHLYRLIVSATKEDGTRLRLEYLQGAEVLMADACDIIGQFSPDELTDRTFCLAAEIRGAELVVSVDGRTVWETTLPEPRSLSCGVGLHGERGRVYRVEGFRLYDSAGAPVFDETFADPAATVFGNRVVDIPSPGALYAHGALLLAEGPVSHEAAGPVFQKSFSLAEDSPLEAAYLYATACGAYEARLNDAPVTDTCLNPGNMSFHDAMEVQTYDVTSLVQAGDNRLEFTLGHGWYDRATAFDGAGAPWGDRNSLLAQVHLLYADGTHAVVSTDDSWRVSRLSPVLSDDLWQGEVYDARVESDFSEMAEVVTPANFSGTFVAQTKPPIVVHRVLSPVSETVVSSSSDSAPRAGDGAEKDGAPEGDKKRILYDFGQNLTGVLRVRLRAKAGTVVTLRHAEKLADKTLDTNSLDSAQAIDRYIACGEGEECFVPAFTFHGFRYAELTTEEDAQILSVEALALSADLDAAGSFVSSHDGINRLMEVIDWTIRDNFLSVPMDCPQRAERFGWTGDAQLILPTASYLYDVNDSYAAYLSYLTAAQNPETGAVPDLAPYGISEAARTTVTGNNAWGDAVVLIPWELYVRYGNRSVLEETYPAMTAWVRYLAADHTGWLRPDEGFGDHLSLQETPLSCVNTAYAAHVSRLLSRIAALLGHDEDAQEFATYAERFRAAWCEAFVHPETLVTADGSQTAYVLGLAFDLYPEKDRAMAAENLLVALAYSEDTLQTGFVGSAYLLEALCDHGYVENAYALLERTAFPGWLYMTEQGATTLWEQWDGKGSQNHFAFGSVGRFLYEYVGGIRPDPEAPGFRHFFLEPVPGGSLTHCAVTYPSPFGVIESSWEKTPDGVTYRFVIPPGSAATVRLPGEEAMELAEGNYTFHR